jgi:hypothetical protein
MTFGDWLLVICFGGLPVSLLLVWRAVKRGWHAARNTRHSAAHASLRTTQVGWSWAGDPQYAVVLIAKSSERPQSVTWRCSGPGLSAGNAVKIAESDTSAFSLRRKVNADVSQTAIMISESPPEASAGNAGPRSAQRPLGAQSPEPRANRTRTHSTWRGPGAAHVSHRSVIGAVGRPRS